MFKLAIKNILRNKRRTFLSGLTIFLATIAVIALLSLLHGMIDSMTSNTIHHNSGNIQVNNAFFVQHERILPLGSYIHNTQEKMQQIKTIDGVTSVSRKSIIPVSIWMGEESHDSVVKAIDFNNISYFGPDQITQMEGRLPSKASKETLITTKLANAQHLKRGDTFTFLSKTATGGSNALGVTVTGIVTFKDNDLNTNSFYISPDTLSSMLRENDGSLALMIYTNGEVLTQTVTTTLNDDTLLVRSWHEMNAIQDILDYSSRMYTYMEIIFFLLASTVIINTTMMSVIERKREAATLMALGFESSWVRNLFLLESTLISVVASLTGTLIGAILVNTLGRKGISLDVFGGDAISGYGLNTVLYFTLPIKDYMTTILYAVGIAMIACIFPTRKILKLQIATALHDEI